MTSCFGLRVTNMHSYHISNDLMPSPVIVRDLGIFVDRKLNFSQHLRSVTAKAPASCCLIFKCFFYRRILLFSIGPLLFTIDHCWSTPLALGRHVTFLVLRWSRQSSANLQKGFEGCQTLTTRNASPFLMPKHLNSVY